MKTLLFTYDVEEILNGTGGETCMEITMADAAAKAGNVTIVALDRNKPANAEQCEVPIVLVVKMEGEVAEVESAMQAGIEAAKAREMYITSYIITRQEEDTKKLAKLNALGHDKISGPRENASPI